jgi:RNA recognition motif-containing protein
MQTNKLYVGNLNYSTTEDELKELCQQYGNVESVKIIEGKGFGFVEMANEEDVEAIKEKLNGYEFKGRKLRVDVARPQQQRNGGGSNGGPGGGGFKKRFPRKDGFDRGGRY